MHLQSIAVFFQQLQLSHRLFRSLSRFTLAFAFIKALPKSYYPSVKPTLKIAYIKSYALYHRHLLSKPHIQYDVYVLPLQTPSVIAFLALTTLSDTKTTTTSFLTPHRKIRNIFFVLAFFYMYLPIFRFRHLLILTH